MQTPTHYLQRHRAMYLQSAPHSVQNASDRVVRRNAAQMLRDSHKLLVSTGRKNGYFAQVKIADIPRNSTEIRVLVAKPAICFEPDRRDVQKKILAAGIGGFWLGFVRYFAVQTEVDSEAEHASTGSELNEHVVLVEEISGVEWEG